MSLDDYLALTPSQFAEAYRQFLDKTKSDREFSENVQWQVARWQVFRTLCPPKSKTIHITDLIKLPGDDKLIKQKAAQAKRNPADQVRFEQLKEQWKDG